MNLACRVTQCAEAVDQGGESGVGKHDDDDKKEGDGKWDKPIPPANPPGGGKHEKGK